MARHQLPYTFRPDRGPAGITKHISAVDGHYAALIVLRRSVPLTFLA